MTASIPAGGAAAQAWARAAQRALAADLPHQLRQRGASILVPSKSADGVTYHVALVNGQAGACDCQAALNGRAACAHRAAVALRLAEREAGIRITAIKSADVVQRFVRAA